MKEQFTPMTMARAEKVELETKDYEQDPGNDVIRILAWADSRAEIELMESMSDDELEAYLDKKRKGGRE